LLAGAPAAALVGDAAPAEWTIARPAVMVFSSHGQCSGVVLAQDLVLTAAHCVVAATNVKIVGHIAAAPFQLADVTKVALHPQYDAAAWPTADLALLKLSKQLPTGFARAFLGTRAVAVSDRLIVIGYGVATQSDNKSAGTPRMATLTVTAHSDNVITLRDAGGGKISGCIGDSGAPAFAVRGGVRPCWVVSRGHCGGSSLVIPFARSGGSSNSAASSARPLIRELPSSGDALVRHDRQFLQ
jgi:V8-like Glu-specific endopeptidase